MTRLLALIVGILLTMLILAAAGSCHARIEDDRGESAPVPWWPVEHQHADLRLVR